MDVYERLEEMDADTAEVRAAEILHGLGFSKEMIQRKCRNFSGQFVYNYAAPEF